MARAMGVKVSGALLIPHLRSLFFAGDLLRQHLQAQRSRVKRPSRDERAER